MERILMHICLAGLALSSLIWLASVARTTSRCRPRCAAIQKGKTRIFAILFLSAFVIKAIVYGSSKAPTNNPPPRILAPPRSLPAASQHGFSAEEITSGYVLWRVGTNETWNFDAPSNATIAAKWRLRGAAEDSIVLTNGVGQVIVDTHGRITAEGTKFHAADFHMGVLPECKWPLLGWPSLVWFAHTPWRSRIVTWQNVLANRDLATPISVQLELMDEGDYICRYDWSRAGGNETNVTSKTYYRIRPEDFDNPDRDGDGISSADEVSVYHTDPGLADTDGDGLGDGEDTEPLNPDTDGDGIPDGMTAAEYWSHPLWSGTNSWEVSRVAIRLNEPVVPPARAVLVVGELPIILTTNAVYRLCLDMGIRYDVRLVTNGIAPVNLSLERGEE